jgi:hypothetical protein
MKNVSEYEKPSRVVLTLEHKIRMILLLIME